MEHPLPLVQNVLNRMKRAHESGRGVRISAVELSEMSCSIFGEIWEQDDPRHLTSRSSRAAEACTCKDGGLFDFGNSNICINCGGTVPPPA